MSAASPLRPSRRVPVYAPIAILMAAAAVVLLFLGRSMTFWRDEWGSITFHGDWLDVIRPVNEHWSTFPLPLYRATFALVGLHSYIPYLAEVIALHLVAVAAAFLLIRRRAGDLVATLACIPLLFLGSGSENLFWAFQTGFVGSVAFGLWGLVLLERPGRRAAGGAALLLIASLTSSGMGLFFLVVAFGRTLLDPALRPRLIAVVPPAIVYAIWTLTVGRAPVQAGHLADLVALKTFVIRGVAHAVGAVSGLGSLPRGDDLSIVAFVGAFVATGWAVLRSRRPPALAAGALLAIIAMYAVIGLVRAEFPSDFATRSRYVYVAAFLLMLAVVDWVPILRGWAASRRRGREVLIAGLGLLLVGSTAANLAAFGPIRTRFQGHADLTRAYIALADANRGASWVDPASVLPGMPRLPDLLAIIDRYGSPVHDALLPGLVRAPSARAREQALLRLVGSGFRAEPASGATSTVPLVVLAADDMATTPDGACLTLTRPGPRAQLTLSAPSGSRIRLVASDGSHVRAALGQTRPPSTAIDVDLAAGIPTDIVIPDIGDGSTWTIRLETPGVTGSLHVCTIGPS